MVLYCTADDTGPLDPVDWSALPKAARAACPSHVVRSGNGPRVAPNRAATAAEMAECEAILAAAGHDIYATTDAGEPLRCPVCLAPLRASASAETWVPPEGLPADPVPEPVFVFRHASTLVPGEATVSSTDWQTLGLLTTAAGGLVEDLSRCVGAVVGRVEADGAMDIRLVAKALDGTEAVLVSATFEGTNPYVQAMTNLGAIPKAPQEYRIEGRALVVPGGKVRGMSLALYEVQ